jgi:tRNA threonylcarbamoyladenosine biosynthesis protein TsaE
VILANEAETHAVGQALAGMLRSGDIIALFGDLGAGKTSLARGILSGLGLNEEAPSPSFPLVIPYDPPTVSLPVWHVDLYRLEGPEQAEELGLDEALIDGALIIEWPDRLGAALWPEALKLTLEPEAKSGRRLTAQVPPSWEGRCPIH